MGKYLDSKYNKDDILLLHCAVITNMKVLGSRYRAERLVFLVSI